MADVCVVRAAGLAEWTNMSKVQQAPWFYMQREAKRVYESTHKYWENEKTRLTRQAATVTAAKAAAAKRKAKTTAKAKQTVTGAKPRAASVVKKPKKPRAVSVVKKPRVAKGSKCSQVKKSVNVN